MPKRSVCLITILLILGLPLPAAANNNIDNLIKQALQNTETGNLTEAQAILEKAVKSEPSSSLAYTRLGGVQLLQQEYSSGIRNFQQAIMLDQPNSEAFIGLAVAYLHLGRYQLAREALKQAEQLNPAKKQEIDKVVTWLNQRSSKSYGH